jgi:hypothetical protein
LTKNPKITTILPDEVFRAIEKIAQQHRHTLSKMTAIICEDYLREHGHLPKE